MLQTVFCFLLVNFASECFAESVSRNLLGTREDCPRKAGLIQLIVGLASSQSQAGLIQLIVGLASSQSMTHPNGQCLICRVTLRSSFVGLKCEVFGLMSSAFCLRPYVFGIKTSVFGLGSSVLRRRSSALGLRYSVFRVQPSDLGLR